MQTASNIYLETCFLTPVLVSTNWDRPTDIGLLGCVQTKLGDLAKWGRVSVNITGLTV